MRFEGEPDMIDIGLSPYNTSREFASFGGLGLSMFVTHPITCYITISVPFPASVASHLYR